MFFEDPTVIGHRSHKDVAKERLLKAKGAAVYLQKVGSESCAGLASYVIREISEALKELEDSDLGVRGPSSGPGDPGKRADE